uniref:Uncharacterized protein n=1 Tax=viral metagenome TaxID=1070528 RepID=A0A6M3LJX0_9ZZZZ
MKMYIQVIGNSKNNIVYILKEEGIYCFVKNIKLNFIYKVSKIDFTRYYREFNRKPAKIKRTPVRRR